jgi:hypothetical protein
VTNLLDATPNVTANRSDWMRAIAGKLTDAGLAAKVRETFAWLDVTATAREPSRKEPEVSLDADGYSEIRWWNDPTTTPADVAARISRVLDAASLPLVSGPDSAHLSARTP